MPSSKRGTTASRHLPRRLARSIFHAPDQRSRGTRVAAGSDDERPLIVQEAREGLTEIPPRKVRQPTPEEVAVAEAQIVDQSKRIEFYITEYSVEMLASKIRSGDYVVPTYQREYTWEHARKSKFIESVIMGLHIPFLFFWEMPDGRLEIVDGSQRLRTLEEFILGDLRLGDLDQLTGLSGFTFIDLPVSRQRKIRNRSIRGIVLNEHADDAARLDMFERINTGSKIPNTAEVRRGALAGPFLNLVIELAGNPLFVQLAPMSKHQRDERQAEELVTRFFAYGDGLDNYHDRPSEFIFNYSKKMNIAFAKNPDLSSRYRQLFLTTMHFVDRVFPYGFRKSTSGKATPRARFEAIAIGSRKALDIQPELETRPSVEVDVESWIDSSTFTEVTGSDGANAIARLVRRIGYVQDKLVRPSLRSDLLNFFEERFTEIESYLALLQTIEEAARSGPPRIETSDSPITTSQQKILYSSVYLQLYNLVEATISRCINEIANAATSHPNHWRVDDLNTALRREWVRAVARTHTDLTPDHRLSDAVAMCDHLIAQLPIEELQIDLGGGGNWDDEEIIK